MTLVMLLLSVAAAQAYVVAAAWLGLQAPDPVVGLAAFAGLWWPRRTLPLAALVLGLGRAVVLAEPAGGQVFCAWFALAVVAAQRPDPRRAAENLYPRFAWAALSAAGAWALGGWVLRALFDVPLQSGRELFLGVLVVLPLAKLAMLGARSAGWVAVR